MTGTRKLTGTFVASLLFLGTSRAGAQSIDLSDIIAGGDGSGTAPAQNTGIDPRDGHFTTDYINNYIYPADWPYISSTDSPYIDSVFIIGPNVTQFGNEQRVTQSGVSYTFEYSDGVGWGFNYILKDRNGGVSIPPVRISGADGIVPTAIGMHSYMGVTFSLDALRATYGADRIGCFNTFWGMDACQGDANLYAFLLDELGVEEGWFRSFRATAETGTFIQLEIPPEAKYLVLATGANNGGYCDHGTFGMPIIVDTPCLPPTFVLLRSVSPSIVSTLGGTEVTFTGWGFYAQDEFFLGSLPLESVSVSGDGTRATGISPEMDAGVYDATVNTPNGPAARLRGAVVAVAPGPVLASVTPSVLSSLGGETVTFDGAGFQDNYRMLLGGIDLVGVVFWDETRLIGTTPPLPAGTLDAVVTDGSGETLASLSQAVQVVAPPTIALLAVAPSVVASRGGVDVTFTGSGFREGFVPRIGGIPLLAPIFLDESRFRGVTPELDAGTFDADLVDENDTVVAVLAGAVTVIATPEPPPPGPTAIEATLAQGTARFTWANPVLYQQIQVTDLAGQLVRTLPGTARVLEVDSRGFAEVAYKFKGIVDQRVSDPVSAVARPLNCDLPAPLGGYGLPGKYDFPIYGNPFVSAPPAHCAPGLGGGAGVLGDVVWKGFNGFIQEVNSLGYSASARAVSELSKDRVIPHIFSRQQITTGFTLDRDVDSLLIEGYYQKLGESSGLALKGRLTHIDPRDGFVDEFTFPEVPLGRPKFWNGVLYFRADRDVITVTDPQTQACGLKIPQGDYLLEIFAINGDADQPYYVFADDSRDKELLIPGAPCPPYPLVRVTDMTGHRTLPFINRVSVAPVSGKWVRFTAAGYWIDEAGSQHSIDPADANYAYSGYEFDWEIDGFGLGKVTSSGTSNSLTTEVFDVGCYQTNIKVRDPSCNRWVLHNEETILRPSTFTCDKYWSFLYPVPDLQGVRAVAGLTGLPTGRMQKPRRLRMKVLVVHPGACRGDASAMEPEPGDVQFRLAWFFIFLKEGLPASRIHVIDECAGLDRSDMKYFHVDIDDLGDMETLAPNADNLFLPVLFQAKTVRMRKRLPSGQVSVQNVTDDDWHTVSVFQMTNRPESLVHSYWSGSYSEGDQSYTFITQSSEDYQQHFQMKPSEEVNIPLPGLPGIKIPSFPNDFSAGLNSEIRLVGGVWQRGKSISSSKGQIMGNHLSGSPVQMEGSTVSGAGGGLVEGGGGDLPIDLPKYQWCKRQEILNQVLDQTLFESILYSGFIGPVQVTVWASVSLAIRFAMSVQAGMVLSPFAPLQGGNFVEADLFAWADLDLSLPARIRTDVFYGIASADVALIPKVSSDFRARVGVRDTDIIKGVRLFLDLKVDLSIGVCILRFLQSLGDLVGVDTCHTVYQTKLIDKTLIDEGSNFEIGDCPTGGGGGGGGPGDQQGAGGEFIPMSYAGYYPAIETSPDGNVTIEVMYQKSSLGALVKYETIISVNDRGLALEIARLPSWEVEPSIAFLSDRLALIAWAKSLPRDAGIPGPPEREFSLDELNVLKAQDEVVVSPVRKGADGRWKLEEGALASDLRAEVPDPLDRRADGRPALGGDLAHGDAWAAWVRIDDPQFFKEEIGEPADYYEPAVVGGKPTWVKKTAPGNRVRANLDKTVIEVRRVDDAGPRDAMRQISGDGINIEPAISVSPTGAVALCVWVNDPIHRDLITSNRGRNLLYSWYDRASDAWSAPRAVLADPGPYPGVLEPSISLKGDGDGLLAFTALPADVPEIDSGITGANRSVYICKLQGGVFDTPRKIHGKCEKRVYGGSTRVVIPPLVKDPKPGETVFARPDYYIFYQKADSLGRPEAAGGMAFSTVLQGLDAPTAPVSVHTDPVVRSSGAVAVTVSGIRSISLNSGAARLVVGGVSGIGGGGAEPADPAFEVLEMPLVPDLAIAGCTLSNPFPGAGATVEAEVEVENLGAVGSAIDASSGASLCGVRAVFVAADGSERVGAEGPLAMVLPGGSATAILVLEMPLDPVSLRVEVTPNPGDADSANDFRVCLLGAPSPAELVCETVPTGEEDQPFAVQLTWTSPVPYEEVLVYRDGLQFASLPGSATTLVDRYTTSGTHTYEVRGRIEVSRSRRQALECVLEVKPPVLPAEAFRRGDMDGDLIINITDPIFLLGHLFLGGPEPPCPDATDANDDGLSDISDAIFILRYLFLGGTEPPAPGPAVCGSDPTRDVLGVCAGICR